MAQIKTYAASAVLKDGFHAETSARNHTVIVDLPEQMGGTDQGPSSLEVMLMGLASCILTIGRIVARQKRLELRGMRVEVQGDVDMEHIIGKASGPPAGFQEITVHVHVDSDQDLKEKRLFVQEIESRCPVSNTVMKEVPLRLNVSE